LQLPLSKQINKFCNTFIFLFSVVV